MFPYNHDQTVEAGRWRFMGLQLENAILKDRISELEKQIEQQNEDRLKLARSC